MKWKSLLAKPVDGASLAVFRMGVGLLMALEAYSLCRPSAITFGKIPLEVFFTAPDIKLHFPYPGLEWLPLLPARGIYFVVGVLAVSGVMMALGVLYRISAAAVFLSWAYLFVVESTRTYWNSYYYSELLVTFLLIWMPAARSYSVDAWLSRRRNLPKWVPFWTLAVLRGQLIAMYFFGGVAKLNADWLLDAEPVRYHLARAAVKGAWQTDAAAYFISYAGLIFDLGVGFLLLMRRTRLFALVLLVIFHVTNRFVIFNDIDWFPFLGLATSLIFLEADWPKRFGRWLQHPKLARPDWPWFVSGGLLFPVVGAALGWKASPSAPVGSAEGSWRIGRWVAPLVTAWLAWQVLMPLRQLVIPGDARFTWEGLSFSWRLKADVYRTLHCDLVVDDRAIASRDPQGQGAIDWSAWHGEKVIYRTLSPGRINWSHLPEVVILLEPLLGERIIYNPFAGGQTARTESQARERVQSIWQELYGHRPEAVLLTYPVQPTVSACANRLRAKGYAPKTATEVFDLIRRLLPAEQDKELRGVLLHLTPFGLEGEPAPSSDQTPFLLIHDRSLFRPAGGERLRIDPARWVQGASTLSPRDRAGSNSGAVPAVVYTGTTAGEELRDMVDQASICDVEDHPERPAYISWNYIHELTVSQGMHVSTQPFLLRSYARHVADLWQKEYGRRPAVHAATGVSLNGRPFQALVDPGADLATVSARWLEHNPWIRDLETPRIPQGRIPVTLAAKAGP